jgi:hypothetical protein
MAEITLTAEDSALLTEVVSMDDTLFAVAHATKLIESMVAYPIESVNQLRVGFNQHARDDKLVYVGRCTVSWEKVDQYFGKSRFPIRNRKQLLSAIIVSLEKEHVDVLASWDSGRALKFQSNE